MNVSFSTVSNWENGRSEPLPSLAHTLIELAEDAGIDPGRYSKPGPRRR